MHASSTLLIMVTFLLLAVLSLSLPVDHVQKYNREDYEAPSSSPARRPNLKNLKNLKNWKDVKNLKRVIYPDRNNLDEVLHKLKKPHRFSQQVDTDDMMDRLLRIRRASMPK